ncbi:MAG TPA: hypothetical protein VJV23_00965 [Candidatus Polarisedimenticolia bacterium]|nr:hypothetical protein [Candidatus Polarisedimenticolia bacterium]
MKRGARPNRRLAAVLAWLLPAIMAGTAPLPAEVQPLTLYQKTARAALVVRARTLTDSTRRPRLLVLEAVKGSYPERATITIVPYAQDNANPTPWLRREVFRKGEESLLFLMPYADPSGRGGGSDVFSVLGAHQGKVPVPPEGADALLAAVRRFSAILAQGQLETQALGLRAMLKEKNPLLIEAGLEECLRLRLAEREDLDPLRALLDHPRTDLRASALALMRQILEAQPREEAPAAAPPDPRLFEAVAARARLDEDPAVRLQAVGALASFGHGAALALLESIGTADPSQHVRYEALVAARRIKEGAR